MLVHERLLSRIIQRWRWNGSTVNRGQQVHHRWVQTYGLDEINVNKDQDILQQCMSHSSDVGLCIMYIISGTGYGKVSFLEGLQCQGEYG